MIDSNAIMLDFLQANGSLVAIVGTRIHASRITPTEGWSPAAGSALVFNVRSEQPNGEAGQVINTSFQFNCYGGGGNINTQRINAQSVARALYDALNFGTSYHVMGARREGGGDTLVEEETNFVYVPAFFQVQLRKTA